jgi:hypothetical protein
MVVVPGLAVVGDDPLVLVGVLSGFFVLLGHRFSIRGRRVRCQGGQGLEPRGRKIVLRLSGGPEQIGLALGVLGILSATVFRDRS